MSLSSEFPSSLTLGQYYVSAPVAVLPEVWYMKLVGRNSNDQDMCTWYLGCTVAPCNICGMIICTYGIVFMYNFTWSFYMLCTLSEMTNKRWTIIWHKILNKIKKVYSSFREKVKSLFIISSISLFSIHVSYMQHPKRYKPRSPPV